MTTTKITKAITIKELIDIIKEWIIYLLSQWKIISIIVIISGAIGFLYALNSKKKYVARLTFALEDKSGNIGSYAAIASQFGLDLGGSNSGAFSGDNLLELMKSRLMIEKTLLTPVFVDNRTDLLINRYIEYNNLREKWDKTDYLKNIEFKVNVPRSKYSLKQDSLLNSIQNKIVKDNIVINRFDKRLNLVYIECKSEDEIFAKYFTEELVSNASTFYIETKTKKSRGNVAILEYKIDSVKAALDRLLYYAAVSQDQNINLVKAKNKVPYLQTQIDIQLLTAAYVELSKNHELASFSLQRDEPIVQVIDTPILPLKYEKPGKATATIIFGVISGILMVIILILKKILYQEFKKEYER